MQVKDLLYFSLLSHRLKRSWGAEIRKNHTIKLPDAVIASTALAYDLILLTRNVSDFKNIDDLKLINPHEQ